jgi:hypothetical protein
MITITPISTANKQQPIIANSSFTFFSLMMAVLGWGY